MAQGIGAPGDSCGFPSESSGFQSESFGVAAGGRRRRGGAKTWPRAPETGRVARPRRAAYTSWTRGGAGSVRSRGGPLEGGWPPPPAGRSASGDKGEAAAAGRGGGGEAGNKKTWPRAPAPRPQYLCVPQARCRQPGGPGQGLQRRGAVAPGRVIPPPRLFPLPPGPPSPGSAVVPGPSSPPKALPPPPSTDRSESRRGGGRLAPLDPPGGLAPLAPPRRAAILAAGGGGGRLKPRAPSPYESYGDGARGPRHRGSR